MRPLQIPNPLERAMVRGADVVLAPLGWARKAAAVAPPPRRVLLLRLERIGDLLMTLDAIGDARAYWPEAEIDLAVGSWNRDLAALIPGISRVDVVDVPWLAREGRGATWPTLLAHARGWRARAYDLVVNFEPDLRSNLLARLSRATRRFGYWTGGGGALLTDASAYAPLTHVSNNARQLVARAAGRSNAALPAGSRIRMTPPADAIARADEWLRGASQPLVGIHASGGRESKQWHLDRFAAVGRALAASHGATIVLTGAPSDRPLVDAVKQQLGAAPVVDACGSQTLPVLAAMLARLDVLVTGDTGPMHLAAAVGTPIVALFGPSNPVRYGPLSADARVVRIDLPCSPCGQVRLPPVRCRGHVPDCLDGISVQRIVDEAVAQLDARPLARRAATSQS